MRTTRRQFIKTIGASIAAAGRIGVRGIPARAATERPNILVILDDEIREESPVWPAWEWTRHEQERIEWPDYWINRKKRTN